MKRRLSGILLLAAVIGYAHAQNDVYLCVDKNGVKEYKNTGATKGCKKVDLPPLTIAAPVKRAAPAPAAKPGAAPADFPKVDGATQKTRDNDRRQILLDEMNREEQRLADLRKEYNNGEPERQGNERNYAKYQERVASLKESMERSEKNIEALKRELGTLK